MRRTVIVILAVILAVFSASTCSANEDTVDTDLLIYRQETAPIVDGIISEGEYSTVAEYPNDSVMNAALSNDEDYFVGFYAAWDSEYLYFAIKSTCTEHIAYEQNDHYAYNAHHISMRILATAPENSVYVPENKKFWVWNQSNSDYASEFLIYLDSKTDEKHSVDVLGNISSANGFEYYTASSGGYDIYEMKIPFAEIKTAATGNVPLAAELGSRFGIDFTVGLNDIGAGFDGDSGVYRGDYVYLSGSYLNPGGAIYSDCAAMRLEEKPIEVESEIETPTGDSGIKKYIIISVVAAACVIIVLLFVGRRKKYDEDDDENDGKDDK